MASNFRIDPSLRAPFEKAAKGLEGAYADLRSTLQETERKLQRVQVEVREEQSEAMERAHKAAKDALDKNEVDEAITELIEQKYGNAEDLQKLLRRVHRVYLRL